VDGLVVVKIGGSTLGNEDTSVQDLVFLQEQGIPIIVVHGGGHVISDWMERYGKRPVFVDGLRVTDADSMEIVTAVLTGLVNKNLVAKLMSLKGHAVGISGVDGGLIQARITDNRLGYVGTVTKVNPGILVNLLSQGFIPVVSPVGLHEMDGSLNEGRTLNINADTLAADIAYALEAERLIFLTDVEGILDTGGRLIPRITARHAKILFSSGVIKGGMIPKLEASLRALNRVPRVDIVDGRQAGSIRNSFLNNRIGTQIISKDS